MVPFYYYVQNIKFLYTLSSSSPFQFVLGNKIYFSPRFSNFQPHHLKQSLLFMYSHTPPPKSLCFHFFSSFRAWRCFFSFLSHNFAIFLSCVLYWSSGPASGRPEQTLDVKSTYGRAASRIIKEGNGRPVIPGEPRGKLILI
ncbi:hypothetical protein V8G54_016898 [Vigna mungo]|uniref:Uncharacterized protein n=1 Tax=Vigna mungo TaxID=3915 RepID=A0AAQ3NQ05_VIGMU